MGIRAKLREEKLRKKRELELNRSPQRSKFDDMNSDTSDVEDNPAPQKVRKSRFDERREPVEEKSEPTNENKSESDSDGDTSPLQSREPTKAEILEEMTFALRKAMTEILLEVTNEEISGVAAEVLKSETNKKSKHSVKKSGLQGVMANYGSDDENSSNSSNSSSDENSDVEIENRMKK